MQNNFGLQPLVEDKRDFQLGAFVPLPPLNELPESFELTTPFPVKDQGSTDYCSAYASCGVSELQEGVELYPEYSFALSKLVSGDVDSWGQDLRSAMKAHQKYGAITMENTGNFIPKGDLRRFESYPKEWKDKAYKHRKQSYFATKGPYDAYDNIRASIWKFREEKRAVEFGVIFAWPLEQFKLNTVETNGFGHAMYITGWDKNGLIVVNSYGESAGKNGKHRMTRNVIEAFVGHYGAYMMIDVDPDVAKEYMERGRWTLASFWGKVLIWLRR